MLAVESRLRKQPSQARSRLTVDAFLEAADRILRRDGYEAASTNRLARVAGFSVGSLYQYFDDKQAVVGTLLDRELRREARDLVSILNSDRVDESSELMPRALAHLIEGRLEAAHLHRTLANHCADFCGDGALAYLDRQQAPITSDTVQRLAGAELLRMGAGELQPRLDIGVALVQAVTHWLAVETPVHVDAGALAEVLGRTLSTYLDETEGPSPEACELVGLWLDDVKRERSAHDCRPRRLQEVRSLLLRSPSGLAALEPAVFVGAAIYDLMFKVGQSQEGRHSQAELARHFARVIDALPR